MWSILVGRMKNVIDLIPLEELNAFYRTSAIKTYVFMCADAMVMQERNIILYVS